MARSTPAQNPRGAARKRVKGRRCGGLGGDEAGIDHSSFRASVRLWRLTLGRGSFGVLLLIRNNTGSLHRRPRGSGEPDMYEAAEGLVRGAMTQSAMMA